MTTFNTFQEHIAKYRLASADHAYVAMGLIGEIGELYGYLAKSMRDKYQLDKTHIEKELGDILWFVGAFANDIGSSLEKIAQQNIAKISARAASGTIQGSGDER